MLVLTGRGPFGDAWHDHAATSHAIARLLESDGFRVVVGSTFPDTDLGDTDLVVVNAGRGVDDADDWYPLRAALHDGPPLLALHQSANGVVDADALCGQWVEGRSWHPPFGPASFRVVDDEHPVTAGMSVVHADDERYLDLVVSPESRVLLVADHAGVAHPVVWVAAGPRRVVYDALGHDVRSYDSPSRRDLLLREARWLVGR